MILLVFDKLLRRNGNPGNAEIINGKIEEIKNDIGDGSADVIRKLTEIQKQLRRSKKTLVLEVGTVEPS